MTNTELAKLLREAITVLDEPFHHDAIARTLEESATRLDGAHTDGVGETVEQMTRVIAYLEKLHAYSEASICAQAVRMLETKSNAQE